MTEQGSTTQPVSPSPGSLSLDLEGTLREAAKNGRMAGEFAVLVPEFCEAVADALQQARDENERFKSAMEANNEAQRMVWAAESERDTLRTQLSEQGAEIERLRGRLEAVSEWAQRTLAPRSSVEVTERVAGTFDAAYQVQKALAPPTSETEGSNDAD